MAAKKAPKKAAKKASKKAPGRPPKKWSEEQAAQFRTLCAIFCTKSEVCAVLGMDPRTLDKNIAETYPETPTWDEAFERYSGNGRATLRRRMFELAQDGDKAALIFMAKNHLGMSDDGLRAQRGERPAEYPDDGKVVPASTLEEFRARHRRGA